MKFYKNRFISLISIILVFTGWVGNISGRTLYYPDEMTFSRHKTGTEFPNVQCKAHDINRLGLTITNMGVFGSLYSPGPAHIPPPSGIYPYPGNVQHLAVGAFWIGAVIGDDTLVSVGADGWKNVMDMWPDPYPGSEIIRRSILDPDDEDAVSEQDFITTYTDTFLSPYSGYIDLSGHRPLGIEITQKSYAWSYSYAEDFILFDLWLKNLDTVDLEDVYMGIFIDGDVMYVESQGYDDDVSGFKRTIPSPLGCGFIDTINIAWIADNDGRDQAAKPCPDDFDLTSVTGVRLLNTPLNSKESSFNWWISNGNAELDWGPRLMGTPGDPFRDFGGFLGTPEGDKNKYYIMRHDEFDYNQLSAALDHTSDGWLPPPALLAVDFADGFDTRYLLSFGPFDLSPGEHAPVTFAYVGGEDFHTDCDAFGNIFNPYYPYDYDEYLNFNDFGLNAVWASWMYDNPGYDTDGDGFKGKFHLCVQESTFIYDTIQFEPILIIDTEIVYTVADTLWYEGDGLPDFRGAAPPPPPTIRVKPRLTEYYQGELHVRWNGLYSETAKDFFSNLPDFEGYRAYISLTPRASDFTLVCSYDIEDYNKYIWDYSLLRWELRDPPFTIDSLQKIYPGIDDPFRHGRRNPFPWKDSLFYFTPQEWNQSNTRDTNLIHKVYPEQPPPSILDPELAAMQYPEEVTEDGNFKYFEYKYIFRNLLPSQLYYITITAFDYGSLSGNVGPLETSPTINMVAEYAQRSADEVEAGDFEVVVYPNPYRIDRDYREPEGGLFEGRGMDQAHDDYVRSIHFTNLPHNCTIRIFTLDGDLVRKIEHHCAPDDTRSMHERWDLINDDGLQVVSGIYLYTVESQHGSQIGKIVIIM